MKSPHKLITLIIAASVAATAMHAASRAERAYVYYSWQSVMQHQSDTVIEPIAVKLHSAYDMEVTPAGKADKTAKKLLKDKALAVAINDSLWLVNSKRLRAEYTGLALPYLSNYLPLYFNSKIIYTQYSSGSDNSLLYDLASRVDNDMTLTQALQALTSYSFNYDNAYLLIIDPAKLTVDILTSDLFSQMLTPYLPLRKRYEAMRYYQEPLIINYHFLQYIDLITRDDDVPPLL